MLHRHGVKHEKPPLDIKNVKANTTTWADKHFTCFDCPPELRLILKEKNVMNSKLTSNGSEQAGGMTDKICLYDMAKFSALIKNCGSLLKVQNGYTFLIRRLQKSGFLT